MYRETKLLAYWRELNAARQTIGRGPVELAYAQVCYRRKMPVDDAARYKLP